jgi:hypothetical protein
MFIDRIKKERLFERSLTNYLKLKINDPYEYLKEKIRRGKVYHRNSGHKIELTYWEKIEPIMKALNEVYGDNWDILFEYKIRNKKIVIEFIGFVTRFAQVTIENEKKRKYDGIKDLFVLYEFGNDDGIPYCSSILGGRTTYTFKEYYSYSHSHYDLKPYTAYYEDKDCVKNALYFSKFCLGTSNLSTMILETEESCNNNEDFWSEFFLQMFTIVYYESLSGVPYRRFSDMCLPSINSNYTRASFNKRVEDETFLYNIFKDFKDSGVDLKLFMDRNNLFIDFNSDFEKYVAKSIEKYMERSSEYYLCCKLENNPYELSIRNRFDVTYSLFLPHESLIIMPFVYKQKEYPLVITEIPENGETYNPEKVLMSNTKDYIKRLLNSKILELQKNEAFKSIKESKTRNIRRSVQRDNLSL